MSGAKVKGKKLSVKEHYEKLEKDKKERQKICKAFCDHLSRGLSKAAFDLVHVQTLERYMKAFPEDFPVEDIELAEAKGRKAWEEIGQRQANGSCLGNSRTWFYNMSNRFNWQERVNVESEHKGQVSVSIVSYSSQKASQDI